MVHYRSNPYKNKFVINVAATKEKPVVVLGVPNSNGDLPMIDGNGAKTRTQFNYRNEDRSLIKIGGSSKPAESIKPSRVYVENLDIYGAKKGKSFFNDEGNSKNYSKKASCVYMEYGNHIFLRNNKIHDCSNGIISTYFTDNVYIQGNRIYNNGNPNDIYPNNTYTESKNIVYEYNFMGDLYPNALGNNLKDRSAGTIIRYNRIEGGDRQIDLVETKHSEIKNLPQYKETFIYGNVLLEKRNGGNQQILHYGGDGGDKSFYRNGKLYFYNNTVIFNRSKYTTLVDLSLNSAKLEAFNNIFYTQAGAKNFAITKGKGIVNLQNNIIPTGWKKTHNSNFDGSISLANNIETLDPGFQETSIPNENPGSFGKEFFLSNNSPAIGKAKQIPSSLKKLSKQYRPHQQIIDRNYVNDLGAFESNSDNTSNNTSENTNNNTDSDESFNSNSNSNSNSSSDNSEDLPDTSTSDQNTEGDIFSQSRSDSSDGSDSNICNKNLLDLTKKVKKKTFLVSSESEIKSALAFSKNTKDFVEIVIKKGTYNLSNGFKADGGQLIIRGETGNPEDVKLFGKGMNGGVSHIFWVSSSDVYIGDLTIGEVKNHPIQVHGEKNADNFIAHNLIIKNAGEQMLKGSFDKNKTNNFTDNAVVQCSKFYYSAGIGPQYYIVGIDVHHGKHRLVQYNTFNGIRSPESRVAEYAVHFRSESNDIVVRNNTIKSCDRGIGFGLGRNSSFSSGSILNNKITHDKTKGDVGIGLESANNVLVEGNTILFENDYANAIEYRFAGSYDILIKNNTVNKKIRSRDGGKATIE